MKSYLYIIEAVTNLHVGSGNESVGVVDNLVQRDCITGFPTINASSLKGALRQFFTHETDMDNDSVNYVFGSPIRQVNEKNQSEKESVKKDSNKNIPGAYRFFDARLLFLPVRSNAIPYFMSTCGILLNDLFNTINLFNINSEINKTDTLLSSEGPLYVSDDKYTHAFVEDIDDRRTVSSDKSLSCITDILSKINKSDDNQSGNNVPALLVPDKDFIILSDDDHLPVVARNELENGEASDGNLWYEQFVPRFSCFYFIVMVPDNDKYFNDFDNKLKKSLVQIGGNASVGNGFCRLINMNNLEKHDK